MADVPELVACRTRLGEHFAAAADIAGHAERRLILIDDTLPIDVDARGERLLRLLTDGGHFVVQQRLRARGVDLDGGDRLGTDRIDDLLGARDPRQTDIERLALTR